MKCETGGLDAGGDRVALITRLVDAAPDDDDDADGGGGGAAARGRKRLTDGRGAAAEGDDAASRPHKQRKRLTADALPSGLHAMEAGE